jgi:tetratricopeptide (TPR) repeat protein
VRRVRAGGVVTRRGLALAGVAIAVCWAGACAARRPASLADRLVHRPTEAELEATKDATFDVPGVVVDAPASAKPAGPVKPLELVAKTTTTGTLETADQDLAAAIALIGKTPTTDAVVRAADEYARLKVYDRAEQLLTQALGERPRDARLHDRLARLWRDWGFPDIAWPHASRAEYYDPRSAVVQNTMATIQMALGRLEAAASKLERAVALDPTAAYAFSNLCYVRLKQGDVAGALARCKTALDLAPDFAAARANLALVQASGGGTNFWLR